MRVPLQGAKSSRPPPPQGSPTCDHASSASGHPSRYRGGLPAEADRQCGPHPPAAGHRSWTSTHLLAGCGHLRRHSGPHAWEGSSHTPPRTGGKRSPKPLLQGARAEVHGARGRPPGPQEQQDEAGAGRRGGRLWVGRRPRSPLMDGARVHSGDGGRTEWVPAPGPSSHPEGRAQSQQAQLLVPLLHGTRGEPVSEPRGPPERTFLRSLESEHNLRGTGKSRNQGSLTTTDSKVCVCGGTRILKRVSTRDLTLGSEWPGDAAA